MPLTELAAKNIIFATGARARSLPELEPDGKLIWTYRDAMVPDIMPKSILVVGSGAIGIEFANFYNTLGVDVTVVEVLPRVLPVEDAEISAFAQKEFEKQGITILTLCDCYGPRQGANTVTASVDQDGETRRITVDRVILAVGVAGNVENLGLEGTKVDVNRSHIVINEWGATGEPGVYAIGDVAGPPSLPIKQVTREVICIEKIAGQPDVKPLDASRILAVPIVIPGRKHWSDRSGGWREGYHINVGTFPFVGNGKAIALGEPEGLVKTVFDAKNGELLGAHMVGAEVTELIQGYSIAKTLELQNRADGDRFSPPNTLRNDARVGTRCLWPDHTLLRPGMAPLDQHLLSYLASVT